MSASVVPVTLDVSSDELHFEFSLENWDTYIEKVGPIMLLCVDVRGCGCARVCGCAQVLHVHVQVCACLLHVRALA